MLEADDNATKLCCKIDSIILILIDIKNEINKKQSRQTTAAITLCQGHSVPIPVGVAHSF